LFSVKYPEISERMADDKIADAQNTGADVIASADLGCLLHLEGRIARRGLPIRTTHIAEILAGGDDDAQH
jgi:L-lactate dehydrogenase complex protein LldE